MATGDALRATAGSVVALGGALLVAAMAALLFGDPAAGAERSGGELRAQLAVQALALAGGAWLLRLLLPRPRGGRPPLAGVLALGLAAFAGAWICGPLVDRLAPGLSDGGSAVADRIGGGDGALVLGALLVAGAIPLAEELLFRGVLAGAWVRAGRPGIAIAASAVVFGLAHATVGARSAVVTALIGALLAAAFVLAGSLAAPVLGHALLNAVALAGAGFDSPAALVALAVAVIGATALAAAVPVPGAPVHHAPVGSACDDPARDEA